MYVANCDLESTSNLSKSHYLFHTKFDFGLWFELSESLLQYLFWFYSLIDAMMSLIDAIFVDAKIKRKQNKKNDESKAKWLQKIEDSTE